MIDVRRHQTRTETLRFSSEARTVKKNTTFKEFNGMTRTLRRVFCVIYRRTPLIAVLTLAFITFTPTLAKAASPHGPFSSSTDKCSTCHRLHTGLSHKLLPQETSLALCQSCHTKGTGADTAVMQGIYIDAQNPDQSGGVDNGILLGGGFDRIGDASEITGRHQVGVAGTLPGGSALATDNPGAVITLTCLSCHTPHQGPNYRILRRRPGDAAEDVAVQSWVGNYEQYCEYDFDPVTTGVQGYTDNYKSGIASWCGSCHTNYLTRVEGSYDAGDKYGNRARYRHGMDVDLAGGPDAVTRLVYQPMQTDLPLEDVTGDGRTFDDELTCLSCHRAHGTDAQMTGWAELDPAERGILPAGKDSMLLRQNDRTMCIKCHRIL